ncbi:MAG TPA: ATP-binding protein [Bacteroidales bacterium]
MPKKIAITGPESTGKSWLAEKLAAHYKTTWVPEYAREYLEKNGLKYSIEDLEKIAKGQANIMLKAEKSNPDILIFDTELIVIKIWSEVVFKKCPVLIDEMLVKQKIDLYLLCYPDLPWEFHPMRENPGNREYLFELYENKLKEQKFNYRVVKGKGKERLNNAITFVEEIKA